MDSRNGGWGEGVPVGKYKIVYAGGLRGEESSAYFGHQPMANPSRCGIYYICTYIPTGISICSKAASANSIQDPGESKAAANDQASFNLGDNFDLYQHTK